MEKGMRGGSSELVARYSEVKNKCNKASPDANMTQNLIMLCTLKQITLYGYAMSQYLIISPFLHESNHYFDCHRIKLRFDTSSRIGISIYFQITEP